MSAVPLGRAPGSRAPGGRPAVPLGRAPGGRQPQTSSVSRGGREPTAPRSASARGPPPPTSSNEELLEGKVEIPRALVGKAIGNRGSVINALREQSGAQSVQLDKHGDGSATMTLLGGEDALNRAMTMLKNALLDDNSEASTPSSRSDAPPPRRSSAPGMGREAAEALAEEWSAAKRQKDYYTADALRDRIRKAGFEPDELVEEMSIYGRTEPDHKASRAQVDVTDEPTPYDPRGYQPTVPSRPAGWGGPTDAAKNHKDGGTGGLLTINYSAIVPLPPDIGLTVSSGKISATADPLLALKRLKEEEEERERERIRERNSMAREDTVVRMQRQARGGA